MHAVDGPWRGWRIEQAEEFRQQVEQFTDAERAILAEVYRALLRHGPLPHPGSPLADPAFWFRPSESGSRTATASRIAA